MKKKIICAILALALCFTALAACADGGDPPDSGLTKTAYTFSNRSQEYIMEDTSLTTYYKDGSCVPYVGVEDFLEALSGLFDTSHLQSIVSEEEGKYTLINAGESLGVFCADWEEDTVSVSDFSFFFSFVYDTAATDFTAHYDGLTYWSTPSPAVTFDLGAYGFDILYADGQALLPVWIANLLFCAPSIYNVYFNGEEYFGLDQSDNTTAFYEDRVETRTSFWNGQQSSQEMREVTVNFLEFALDYFYGLKGYKGIDTFKDVIAGELRKELLSTDPAVHNAAYIKLFQQTLNELHTSLISPSFYAAADAAFDLSGENGGTVMRDFSALYYQLLADMRASVGNSVPLPDGSTTTSVPAVRFEGDTAVIVLSGFTVGTDEQIYDEDGTVSENAPQYDTFYFMLRAMQSIEEHEQTSGTTIQNVVLDLTVNTGGSIAAMINALGFMTDKPIPYLSGNLISGEMNLEYMLVDTDGDGDYRDADAYDMYDWYVLSSPVSFSAANLLTTIVKETGFATVIGEQSGGGTCSVFTLVLPDGMTTNISSANLVFLSSVYEQGVITGGNFVESGVTPDIPLGREYFYDDAALVAAIHAAK